MGVQVLLCIYAGAPIFVLMPILIYGPKILSSVLSSLHSREENSPKQLQWHQRLLRRLGILHANSTDQHRRLQKFSLYWEDRFVFAVLRWLSFIAFTAASIAIQATPSPAIACSGTELVTDPAFTCYSEDLAVTHTAGTVIAVLLCMALPYYIFKNIRRISFNDREESPRETKRFGAFFDAYRKGVSQYFFLLNHFQMTVLVTVLSLVLKKDELGLAISNLVLNLAYMLTVVIGRPFTYMLDNVFETATTGVQAYGIILSIVTMFHGSVHRSDIISEQTAEVLRPLSAHASLLP
jgi:hypothetical protein